MIAFLLLWMYSFLPALLVSLGVVAGIGLLEARRRLLAALALALGSYLSASAVALVEAHKLALTTLPQDARYIGVGEALAGAWLDSLIYFALSALALVYLRAGWGSRRMDASIGLAIGVIAIISGSLTFTGTFTVGRSISHTAAFLLMPPLALIGLRWVKGRPPVAKLAGGLVIALGVSLLVALVDYAPFLK